MSVCVYYRSWYFVLTLDAVGKSKLRGKCIQCMQAVAGRFLDRYNFFPLKEYAEENV